LNKPFDDDQIPPTIRLLLDPTVLTAAASAAFQRELGRLLPELQAQAQWTTEKFAYFDPNTVPSRTLVAVGSGGLNPLMIHGACSNARCKMHAAISMARTLGLYADVVVLPDIPTRLIALFSGDPDEFIHLSNQILVLHILEPMIRAGVIRFWPGTLSLCTACGRQLQKEIAAAAAALLRDSGWTPRATIEQGTASLDLERLYGQSIILGKQLTASQTRKSPSAIARLLGRQIYLHAAEQAIRSALIDLRYSDDVHASLFSTLRQPLRAIKAFDSEAPALNRVGAWESPRSIQLPWVTSLTVHEVLALRTEAAAALPAFRESFVRKLLSPDADVGTVAKAVQELRTQASDLQAELTTARGTLERRFRGVYGFLGMSFAIYGAAMGRADAAGFGLLSMLGLLHTSGAAEHKARAKGKSSPAYVLVKARELAEHADE
jgi:hypothetical protein